MRLGHLVVCGGAALGAACTPCPTGVGPVSPAVRGEGSPSGSSASPAPNKPARPFVHASLRANGTADPAHVAVTLRLEWPAGEIDALAFGAAGEPIDALSVRDRTGEISAELAAGGVGAKLNLTSSSVSAEAPVVRLGRPAASPLTVSYRVRAAADVDAGRPLASAIDPTRMRVSGERVLALPSAWDGLPADVELAIDPGDVRGAAAASSFGFGRQLTFVAAGRQLRGATFLAGALGRAAFDTGSERDGLTWLGDAAFDARIVAADFAAFRSAVGMQLGRDPTPIELLVVVDGRDRGDVAVTERTHGALIHVGVGDPFGSDARIAAATALVQRWVGGHAWLGDGPGRLERAWFSEGVARALATALAFRFGTLSSAEYAEELTRLFAAAATSRWRALDQAALVKELAAGNGFALAAARGALYGTRLDAELRASAASSAAAKPGASSLVALVAQLEASQDERVPRADELVRLAEERLGAGAAEQWQRFIARGEAPSLEGVALGPCLRIVARDYPLFALGFDADATSKAADLHPVALDPKGPAARAGLRADDVVRYANYKPGRADVEVALAVERGGKSERIRYAPIGEHVHGHAAERIAGPNESDCAR